MVGDETAMHRRFIDWTTPLLPRVAAELADIAKGAAGDLSGHIIVVPARRAGRRLRELLAVLTGGACVPPQIVTVGNLPELLYEPQRPFASDLVQHLAWIAAIRRSSPAEISHLLPTLPDPADLQGWMSLAQLLWRQHRELAADGLDCGDVLRLAAELDSFREHERWRALAALQQRYLRILDDLGLWDLQTARLVAVRQHEIQTEREIMLVGATDLNRIDRAVLDQVADRVTACIHAPPDLADCFDAHGCVDPTAWSERPIDIAAEQVLMVDGPLDLSESVVRVLVGYEGAFRPDEVTIALAADDLAPGLRRTLAECGVAARWGAGTPLSQSAPCRLLQAVADLLEDDRTPAFAALVRHPDVTDWLTHHRAPTGWLQKLDDFIAEHVPQRIGDWVRDGRAPAAVRDVSRRIDRLIKPFRGRARPLGEWSSCLLELLTTIYGASQFDPRNAGHQAVLSACEKLQPILIEHGQAPPDLAPTTTAAAAIRLALQHMAGEQVPPDADPSALDITGWLDLPLDDAPAAMIVGINEGLIPQSSNADPFLPNALRAALGITDNARRYARDAHALCTVLHSRQHVRLIAARRDRRGDPLVPSRLLLAADAPEVARRIRSFYGERAEEPAAELPGRTAARIDRPSFEIPRPRPRPEPPAVLRVTAFRDYIASPYRFYLRHIERLEEVDDGVDELSAAAFGNLTHNALSDWGQSDLRDSTDTDAIDGFLSEAVERIALRDYGPSPVMAVKVQLEQARMRLAAFAAWQAQWAAQGWRIRFTEQNVDPVPFDLGDGRSVQLKGRIDRIDQHAAGGRWAIFDYKTGEQAIHPDKSHRKDGDWIDLQLPLYRHLARSLGVTGAIQLGYIRLPRDTNDVGAQLAEWTADDLAAADRTAQDVARRILDQHFWEELRATPDTLSEFGPICQDNVFGVRTFV